MTSNREKLETINEYLEDDYCLIHFDTTADGVEVPPHLMDNPSVTLKLSYGFQGGMDISDERIWASLLFGTQYCECIIPFDALWGATCSSGANVIWPEHAPNDILIEIMKTLKNPAPEKKAHRIEPQTIAKSSEAERAKIKRKSAEVPYLKRVK
ncbi:MAG: hypothetical protein H6619_00605 [Deltaproteobacteria bacterium]|nr:hypothetical protein [Deltaproteobacteria bacterium]